jgi:hypothetical protein
MKVFLSAIVASAALVALVGASEAAQNKRHAKRPHAVASKQGTLYPYATARQRANSEAFDRGEYYEQISAQHAVGSRSWWYLKERELGGGTFP